MLLGQKVRITNVDMYGLNGRDLHPQRSDVGRCGVVVKAEREFFDEEPDLPPEENHLDLFTIRMADNPDEQLEMASYEIEAS